jgi:hypothetical protein
LKKDLKLRLQQLSKQSATHILVHMDSYTSLYNTTNGVIHATLQELSTNTVLQTFTNICIWTNIFFHSVFDNVATALKETPDGITICIQYIRSHSHLFTDSLKSLPVMNEVLYSTILMLCVGMILVLFLVRRRYRLTASKCMGCGNKPIYVVNNRFKLCGKHVHSFLRKQSQKTSCVDTRTGEQYLSDTGRIVSSNMILNRILR